MSHKKGYPTYWRIEGWYNWCADKIELDCDPYYVVKETPCGVRVQASKAWPGDTKTHMIYHNAKKKWAHMTKEKAFESFLKRRRIYISYLKERLERAEIEAELAQEAYDRLMERGDNREKPSSCADMPIPVA